MSPSREAIEGLELGLTEFIFFLLYPQTVSEESAMTELVLRLSTGLGSTQGPECSML